MLARLRARLTYSNVVATLALGAVQRWGRRVRGHGRRDTRPQRRTEPIPTMTTAYPTRPDMRGRVGLVVPVWFPEDLPDAVCETLLRTTLADCGSCLRPEHVALVVDGVPRLAALASYTATTTRTAGSGPDPGWS